ncbi:MAG: hypothetical protein Q7S79_03570 [bacterium]|nr:hypothetical protein [bacterium]
MLTKNDLEQISKVLKRDVKSEIQTAIGPVRRDLLSMSLRIDGVEKRLGKNEKAMENLTEKVDKGFKKLTRVIKITSDFHDKENLKIVKRVERIENHLNLPA